MKTKPTKPKIASAAETYMLLRRDEIILAYDTTNGASVRAKPNTSAEIEIRGMLDDELLKLDLPEAVKKRILDSTPKVIPPKPEMKAICDIKTLLAIPKSVKKP